MDAFYANLDRESLLLLSGPDSLKFLQGQTSCDTDSLDDDRALLGAYCSPQGRMVCDFLLARLGEDSYALRMRQDILERAASTLGKYIIFSKAELDADDLDWQVFACWGDDAKRALAEVFPTLPYSKLGAIMGDHFVLVQIDEAGSQFECFLNTAAQPELLAKLTTSIAPGEPANWQALQIDSGIGRIEAPTVEEFIPQMLNYDITGHVSFTKGCYTGQEVVARMHYRGKPKRRMYLASLSGDDAPAAGTTLYTTGSEQGVGNVVNSAATSDSRVAVLVVATVGGIESGLHVGAVDGPVLTVGELPYSMEKP